MTGKKIPTCHRSSFDSVMDDADFDQVMETAIISQETFDAAEAERLRRIEYWGRKWDKKPKVQKPIPTSFRLGAVAQKYKDPYKQAAYAYSLIESGE